MALLTLVSATVAHPVGDNNSPQASMKFENNSDYTMRIRIIDSPVVYRDFTLAPHRSSTVYFSQTKQYKVKIEATNSLGYSSYHDGGTFSVTCNRWEYSTGTMSFQLSQYGSGLGPRISEKEFLSNN